MNYTKMTISLLTVGLAACITTPKKLDNIPLLWRPTSEMQLPPGTSAHALDAKIQFEPFKDIRNNPELIAENRERAAPKPVTTHDNVGEFVSTHMRTLFDRMGLTTVNTDGDVVIGGEVRQFFVDETTTYKGHVVLKVVVRNRAGASLWSGSVAGEATRFGHSYSAENYYEVFSDAVINAASSLFLDPDFQTALAHKSKG